MRPTLPLLVHTDFPALRRKPLDTLQVTLGYKCNQSCLHCHVNAGPNRTEMMDEATTQLVLQVLAKRRIGTLDLTGKGLGLRSERYSMLVKDGKVMSLNVEGPGKFEVSDAATLLAQAKA